MLSDNKHCILLVQRENKLALLTLVHNFLFHMQNVSSSTLATESTVYEIASVTKTATALLMGKLFIERKLRLWDPLEKFIPGFVLHETSC